MKEGEVSNDIREYDCGEYYEIGERLIIKGVMVEVTEDSESSGVCENCFINELSNRDIKCSSLCSGFERKDDTPVHFQLVDLAKKKKKKNTPDYPGYDPNKEYAVYERFQHNGVVAECRIHRTAADCRKCVLFPCRPSTECKCLAVVRKDNTSVYYKRLDDVRP